MEWTKHIRFIQVFETLLDPGYTKHMYFHIFVIHMDLPLACPRNYARIGLSCYLLVQDPPISWEDAERTCIARGSHLIKIEKDDEEKAIQLQLSECLFG